MITLHLTSSRLTDKCLLQEVIPCIVLARTTYTPLTLKSRLGSNIDLDISLFDYFLLLCGSMLYEVHRSCLLASAMRVAEITNNVHASHNQY